MDKYICSTCGYIFDESKDILEKESSKKAKWEDLPREWGCPSCGEGKDNFVKVVSETVESESFLDMKKMTPLELNILCTNLAEGCEKQYKNEEAALFKKLAQYFKQSVAEPINPTFDQLLNLIEIDLNEGFVEANTVAKQISDRGALRALVWSGKVTRILKSLLTRYEKLGDKMLEDTGVYVCTVCGFIYVGNNLPEVCPICKVPNFKFIEVKGRKDS